MTLSLLFIQVTLIKSTLLDLKTLGEIPTLRDLPFSPLFGAVTGICSVPSQNQDNKCYFTLSRKTYNPFNGTYVTMDIPCFYEPKNGRHSNVANTTNSKAVFSTAGELFVGKRLVQMIASEIEWTYQSIEKANVDGKKGSLRKKLKSNHLSFEEKYINEANNQKKRKFINYADTQEESSASAQKKDSVNVDHNALEKEFPRSVSSLKSTKLINAMNVVTNNDKNNKGKNREVENETLDYQELESSDTE